MLPSLLKNLNIDPTVLLLNGVVFLVLLQVMTRLFWKPILEHLDRRKEEIDGAYQTVDDTRREMEELRSEYQARLARIEAEARARIQQTVREAQAQREALIAQARQDAERIVAEGGRSIELEREQISNSMRDALDDVALGVLRKVTGVAPGSAQRALVDEYIAQSTVRRS
jgi:F-type H+-transporting ATPase subunit b